MRDPKSHEKKKQTKEAKINQKRKITAKDVEEWLWMSGHD